MAPSGNKRTIPMSKCDVSGQQERPAEHAVFDRGWWARFDKSFALLVAASIAMHFGTVFLLGEGDPVYELRSEPPPQPARVATVIFREPEAPPDVEEILSSREKEEEPSEWLAEEATPSETAAVDPIAEVLAEDRPSWASDATPVIDVDRSRVAAPSSADDAERPSLDPDLRARAALQAAQQMIGSVMDERGAFADLLRNGTPAAAQLDILTMVDGARVAEAEPGSMMPHLRGPRTPQRGPLEGLALPPSGEGHEFVPEGEHELEPLEPNEVPPTYICWYPAPPHPPRAQLIRVLRSRLPAVRQCYERGLRLQPDMGGGRLTLRVEVSDAAVMTSVTSTEDTLPQSEVSRCVIRVIQRTTLPPNTVSEQTVVEIPLVFSPR